MCVLCRERERKSNGDIHARGVAVLIYGLSDSHAGLGVACCCFTERSSLFSGTTPGRERLLTHKLHTHGPCSCYYGHYLLHIAPVLIASAAHRRGTSRHGLLASCLHVYWFNSIDANSVYVPMLRQEWRILMLVSVVTELATPYVLSLTG